MKKVRNLLMSMLLAVACMSTVSCNDYETYAEQKDKERDAIEKFIADSAITVISEAQFYKQDSMTNAAKNEYVLFDRTGVYLQIVEKGCGEKLKNGERTTMLIRFSETNISTRQTGLVNLYESYPDEAFVYNKNGTYTASFDTSLACMMYKYYQSVAVPNGWLAPLPFIKIGREVLESDRIAKVRLIVPHSQGHQNAVQSVVPYFYEMTIQRGR